MILPLGLHILTDVDIGSIIDTNLEHSHEEAKSSREGKAPWEDNNDIDRELNAHTQGQWDFSAEQVRYPSYG